MSTAAAQAESATPVVQTREVADQSNLVYCNLNDLDFAAGPEGGVYTMGGSGGLSNMQEMVITSSNAGLLQMVQSVPCLQVTCIDVNPHPGFILHLHVVHNHGVVFVLQKARYDKICPPPT